MTSPLLVSRNSYPFSAAPVPLGPGPYPCKLANWEPERDDGQSASAFGPIELWQWLSLPGNVDESRQPPLPGCFLFRAHHPVDAGSPIPRRLGLKEIPRTFLGAKFLL